MVWRRLHENKATQLAHRLVFFDCETRDRLQNNSGKERHKLWFGIARSGRLRNESGTLKYQGITERTFYTMDEFWLYLDDIMRKSQTTWIYAHNAAFDMTVAGFWDRMDQGKLEVTKPRKIRTSSGKRIGVGGLALLRDPPTVLALEDEKERRLVVCDTLNYWRTSLAALGTSLGLEKLDMPRADDEMTDWLRYCRRDVEVIEHAVLQLLMWWKDRDLGNWRWTAPGLAMSAFRHKFMKHDIVFHDMMEVRKIERAAYYGGQLEAYKLGEINQPVWQVDVNSLYPFVMQSHSYPTVLRRWSLDQPLTQGVPRFDPETSIAEIELDAASESFPQRDRESVFYGTGQGTTWLAGPELKYAFDQGYVLRWGRFASFEMAPIFEEYVEYFHRLKEDYTKSGHQVQRTFVKLLLNSLYGKFGQKGSTWNLLENGYGRGHSGIFYESNLCTGKITTFLELGGSIFQELPADEIQNASPAIAAFVTSYARQHMRMLRKVAGDRNYFYQSTDSLLVSRDGYENLRSGGHIAPDRLGGLTIEKEADDAWIGGLHWYRVGDKTVEGGKKVTPQNKWKSEWQEVHFANLKSIMKQQDKTEVAIETRTKHRTGNYTKGIVGADGWITPLTLGSASGQGLNQLF